MTKENQKLELLEQQLYTFSETDTAIVFVNAKKQCDYVSKQCDLMGFPSTVLHRYKLPLFTHSAVVEIRLHLRV
jgi:superfamily II DNA/RNA helicase